MVQSLFFNDIDLAAEFLFQIGDQSAREKGRSVWTGFDQEIEIAFGSNLVAREGTKYSDARHAMPAGNRQDSVSLRGLQCQHESMLSPTLTPGLTILKP